jgi:hypothetical protein
MLLRMRTAVARERGQRRRECAVECGESSIRVCGSWRCARSLLLLRLLRLQNRRRRERTRRAALESGRQPHFGRHLQQIRLDGRRAGQRARVTVHT